MVWPGTLYRMSTAPNRDVVKELLLAAPHEFVGMRNALLGRLKRAGPAAVALGRLGGKAAAGAGVKKRYAAMTAEARSELARRAARAKRAKVKKAK